MNNQIQFFWAIYDWSYRNFTLINLNLGRIACPNRKQRFLVGLIARLDRWQAGFLVGSTSCLDRVQFGTGGPVPYKVLFVGSALYFNRVQFGTGGPVPYEVLFVGLIARLDRKQRFPIGLQPDWMRRNLSSQSFETNCLTVSPVEVRISVRCRVSSVGRAFDWKLKGPQFKSVTRHTKIPLVRTGGFLFLKPARFPRSPPMKP